MVISAVAARGHDTTTLGLFKGRSPSVLINPHFTFHISSRLSGPLDRTQFISLSLLYSHTSSVTHINALLGYIRASVSFQSLLFLSISVLSVVLSAPLLLSSSPHIPPWYEPSRGLRLFFFLPFQQYLTARCGSGGSRFLIPETCPSMDTPLPLARDLQFRIPSAARPPHPQITFQLSHREVTPHRQPHGVFDTHVVCTPVCIHMYSQQVVTHMISTFWAETRDRCMYVCKTAIKICQAVAPLNSPFKDFY